MTVKGTFDNLVVINFPGTEYGIQTSGFGKILQPNMLKTKYVVDFFKNTLILYLDYFFHF